MENFREFNIPEYSGNMIFGNLVFPFGNNEFMGFPNIFGIGHSLKNPKKFLKIFRNFRKSEGGLQLTVIQS